MVVAALCQGGAWPRRGHTRLLYFCFARHAKPGAHRARICQLHRARRFALRCLRRHPHRRQRRGHAVQERDFFVHRRGHREFIGNDRRGHAAHPSVDPDESIPRHGTSHRLFHFYRGEHRRLPHTHRRSAAVSRLSARRAVLVGRKKLLADVGGRHRPVACDLLHRGQNQLCPRVAGRAEKETAQPKRGGSTACPICFFWR